MLRQRGHEQATGTRAPILVRRNSRWSIDCVFDQLASGAGPRVFGIDSGSSCDPARQCRSCVGKKLL